MLLVQLSERGTQSGCGQELPSASFLFFFLFFSLQKPGSFLTNFKIANR
jgi:hypothetical protein